MKRPLGVTLLGAFLVVATCILAASTVTLLCPGTFMDRIWTFKQDEYRQLLYLAPWSGIDMLVLGAVMAFAAYGWLKARRWAWVLVQCIFAVHGGADVVHIFHGGPVSGLAGVVIVVALIAYIRSAGVRAVFR